MGDLLEPWVENGLLYYRSNNASKTVDVLGSLLLSILSGHTRYADMTNLMCDGVNAGLLGISKLSVTIVYVEPCIKSMSKRVCNGYKTASFIVTRPC